MDQTEIGKFISRCRKEKKMTQAQLAEKLNITDRAVSKWETGKSMPDPSIMLDLCEILGVSANELLKGEKADMKRDEKPMDATEKTENKKIKSGMIPLLFSAVLLVGMMVCLICNIAISGHLTWSLIPVSSAAFVWIIFFPGILLGKRGGMVSLLSLSVFILPYLFLLSRLIHVKAVFRIGVAAAIPSMIFLWLSAGIFNRIGKTRRLSAWGIIFLSAIPFIFTVNVLLSKIIEEPILDIWDLLSAFILLILAFAFLFFDCATHKDKGTDEKAAVIFRTGIRSNKDGKMEE